MVSQPKNKKGPMVVAAWVAIATKIYFQVVLQEGEIIGMTSTEKVKHNI